MPRSDIDIIPTKCKYLTVLTLSIVIAKMWGSVIAWEGRTSLLVNTGRCKIYFTIDNVESFKSICLLYCQLTIVQSFFMAILPYSPITKLDLLMMLNKVRNVFNNKGLSTNKTLLILMCQ